MALKIIDYPLDKGEWNATKTKKRYVVWHATGRRTELTNGKNLISPEMFTINDWNIDTERVGAPWLIGRSGVVYRAFPDEHWCRHLRLDKIGSLDRDSVAIELANEGRVRITSDPGYARTYATFPGDKPYDGPVIDRGSENEIFADFSDEQLRSLMLLTLDVCARNNIKPRLYARNDYNETVIDQATVFTHSAIDEHAWDFYLTARALEMADYAGIELIK